MCFPLLKIILLGGLLAVIWFYFLGKKFGGKPWYQAFRDLSNSEKAKRLGISQYMKNTQYLIYLGWVLIIGSVVFILAGV